MEHPPPPSKKNKKGKKRKRSSKKSPSDGARGSAATLDRIPGGGGSPSQEKSPVTHSAKNAATVAKVSSKDYPYPTDYNDHFETPARAYDDIFPLFERIILAKRKGGRGAGKKGHEPQEKKQKIGNETTIYDPYYCAGRAAVHLEGVFQRHKSKTIVPSNIHIQHEKRDFYRDVQENSVPEFDILVTNPPYSGNHKERCLEFAVKQLKEHGRPFFLLMPNYVATKEYFKRIVLEPKEDSGAKTVKTFYVAPPRERPYEYEHPEGTGHGAPPFASVWFCGLPRGEDTPGVRSVMDAFARFHSRASPPTGAPRMATSLRELKKMKIVSGEKRKNPRQRKKMRQQAVQRANDAMASGTSGGAAGSDGGGESKKS